MQMHEKNNVHRNSYSSLKYSIQTLIVIGLKLWIRIRIIQKIMKGGLWYKYCVQCYMVCNLKCTVFPKITYQLSYLSFEDSKHQI